MGKKIRVQRRGRGTPTFRAAKKGKVAPVRYLTESIDARSGVITNILHETGRSAPIAYVELMEGIGYYTSAPEGAHIGQAVDIGSGARASVGNLLPLGTIPEGTMVCNIELKPGDGGKLVRSAGSYATVVSHMGSTTVLKLPSRKSVELPDDCRATVGIVAGGGRREKPYLKSGDRKRLMEAKGRIYPRSKGISMVSAAHPHGGGRHRHIGKPSTVARSTPPGRKVGLIAARQTGRKKKKRVRGVSRT